MKSGDMDACCIDGSTWTGGLSGGVRRLTNADEPLGLNGSKTCMTGQKKLKNVPNLVNCGLLHCALHVVVAWNLIACAGPREGPGVARTILVG